jgi:hypothetical protein
MQHHTQTDVWKTELRYSAPLLLRMFPCAFLLSLVFARERWSLIYFVLGKQCKSEGMKGNVIQYSVCLPVCLFMHPSPCWIPEASQCTKNIYIPRFNAFKIKKKQCMVPNFELMSQKFKTWGICIAENHTHKWTINSAITHAPPP